MLLLHKKKEVKYKRENSAKSLENTENYQMWNELSISSLTKVNITICCTRTRNANSIHYIYILNNQ